MGWWEDGVLPNRAISIHDDDESAESAASSRPEPTENAAPGNNSKKAENVSLTFAGTVSLLDFIQLATYPSITPLVNVTELSHSDRDGL